MSADKIKNIILELKERNNYNKEELFEKLLTNRLNKSLESYYSDLENRADYFENRIEKIIDNPRYMKWN